MLYIGLFLRSVQKLQVVQNATIRIATGMSCRDHISTVLFLVCWLPVYFGAQSRSWCWPFKALYGLGPTYLKNCPLPYGSTQPLWSPSEALLWALPAFQNKLHSNAWRGLLGMAPKFWSSLESTQVALSNPFCCYLLPAVKDSLVLFGIPFAIGLSCPML